MISTSAASAQARAFGFPPHTETDSNPDVDDDILSATDETRASRVR